MNSEQDQADAQANVESEAILPGADKTRSASAAAHSSTSLAKVQSRPWLLWLVVVLLCAAVGAFYWQQTRFSLSHSSSLQVLQESNQQLSDALSTAQGAMQAELQSQVALMQSQVALMQANADSLQQALSEMRTMEQQDEQRLQSLQQRLERQQQDTRTVVTALQRQVAGLQQRDTRWINAEAAYLMRQAEHKLTLENNPAATLQLLRSVDVLLRDQTDPLAQTALQNLAQDIAAIESARVPDRFVLARRVSELAAMLDDVSVVGVRQAMYQQGVSTLLDQPAPENTEQRWIAAVIHFFRSVFVWRQAEQNPLEFLSSDQESLIKLQLRLQFEQARFAVIQSDQRLFEDALEQVAAGLQRYFMQDSELATQLHDDVQALSVQSVQGDLPDISSTRALVEQLQGAEPDVTPISVSTPSAMTVSPDVPTEADPAAESPSPSVINVEPEGAAE